MNILRKETKEQITIKINSSNFWESGKREWSVSGDGLWSDVVSKLGCVSVSSVFNASDSDDSCVNSTGYAIW